MTSQGTLDHQTQVVILGRLCQAVTVRAARDILSHFVQARRNGNFIIVEASWYKRILIYPFVPRQETLKIKTF
jgi:hypothetical protein